MNFSNSPEALSNFVIFGLGILVTSLGFLINRWLSRKQPRKLKLLKLEELSALSIVPKVKDDLTIAYKGVDIQSLYLTIFTLHNSGVELIKDIKFSISFLDSNPILHFSFDSSIPERLIEVKSVNTMTEPNKGFEVSLLYINSLKLYKDKVRLNLFSTSPVIIKEVIGGGPEWTIEYIDYAKESSEFLDRLGRFSNNPAVYLAIIARSIPKMIRLIQFRR